MSRSTKLIQIPVVPKSDVSMVKFLASIKNILEIYQGNVGDTGKTGRVILKKECSDFKGDVEKAILGNHTKISLRIVSVTIENGTNASNIKGTVTNIWNGDDIGVTDNIAKNATAGFFSLNAGGTIAIIKTPEINNSVIACIGILTSNASGTALTANIYSDENGIAVEVKNATTGVSVDMTVLVDTGAMNFTVLYLTR